MRKEVKFAGERGLVLVVSLILLILITLFAVAAIRSSTTELQIAGNAQIRKELSAAAQAAIETRLNTMAEINNLILDPTQVTNITTNVCKDAKCQVTVCRPVCLWAAPVSGGSLVHNTGTTEMTYWEIQAIAVDTVTNTAIETRQGFRVRMPNGSCPTVAPTSPCT